MVIEEKTTSPVNLPTLPPIVEKDLRSDRNPTNAIAFSCSKRSHSNVSMFDFFVETLSVSTINIDITTTIVHEFVPNEIGRAHV